MLVMKNINTMRKCLECGVDFEPAHQKGTLQLYCTSTCRKKASDKRAKQKIYEEAKKELNALGRTDNPVQQQPEYAESVAGTQRRMVPAGNYGGVDPNYRGKDYQELYYEAKINAIRVELTNESLQQRVKELEKEVFDLNSEIDELDNEKGEGVLGSIVEQFKKDPVNSIKFATAFFDNLTTKQKQ